MFLNVVFRVNRLCSTTIVLPSVWYVITTRQESSVSLNYRACGLPPAWNDNHITVAAIAVSLDNLQGDDDYQI